MLERPIDGSEGPVEPPRRLRRRTARRRRRLVALAVVGLAGIAAGTVVLQRHDSSGAVAGAAAGGAPLETLWAADARPLSARRANDLHSVELGVAFRPERTGDLIGLRFFRAQQETAAHTATVWKADGSVAARLVFPASTRSGWQSARFGQPVQLTAGRTYVASYHSRTGYAVQQGFFGGSAVAHGSLTALPDGGGTHNGLFTYAGTSTRPTGSFRASNYWIDVLFRRTGGTAAPTPSATPAPAPSAGPIRPTTAPTRTTSPTAQPSATPSGPGSTAPAPPPPGGAPAPGTVPAAGQVGFRGSVSSLKVVDSAASAPAGTSWQGNYLRVTAGNATLDGVYVKGAVDYGGGGTLTVRNSIIEGNGGIWSPLLVRAGHLDVRDTTVRWRPGAPPPGDGWGNGAIHGDATMTVIRCDISGTPDGIQNGPGNSTFEQNYIHDLARIGAVPNNTHNDGIQMYGGPNLTIEYNRIDLDGYDGTHQNAALFFQPDASSPASNARIVGNYLEGGGYTLRLDGPVPAAVVQDNTFGPLNGGFGYAYARGGATLAVWSGNVTTSGQTVPKP